MRRVLPAITCAASNSEFNKSGVGVSITTTARENPLNDRGKGTHPTGNSSEEGSESKVSTKQWPSFRKSSSLRSTPTPRIFSLDALLLLLALRGDMAQVRQVDQ